MSANSTANQQPAFSSTGRRGSSLTYLMLCVALPFAVGYFISMQNLDKMTIWLDKAISILFPFAEMNRRVLLQHGIPHPADPTKNMDILKCHTAMMRQMFPGGYNNSTLRELDRVSILLHRNGQAESCGNSSGSINSLGTNETYPWGTNQGYLAPLLLNVLEEIHSMGGSCPNFSDKYHVEAFLTRLLYKLLPPMSCHSEEKNRLHKDYIGLYGYCDMGEEKTPILLDHKKLVPNSMYDQNHALLSLLPCHFHTEHGVRITSMKQFVELIQMQINASPPKGSDCFISAEGENSCSDLTNPETLLHVYAVPAGRVFMHVAAYVGQIIELHHVKGADPNKLVYLEVLSVSPAVFDLHNFFTKAESQELVDRALAETRESHKIKRSTTGSVQHHVNSRRTSESGFDTDGRTAVAIKKRCFQVLGFDEYIESHGDGLQILRYNLSTAYIPHMDYLYIDPNLEHNYDSSKKGGNRFATILLYMTDLNEKDGGETVFTEAWPPGQSEADHVPIETALSELRASDQHGIVEEGSWQETMIAQCRTKLAIRPDSARAVLFYSQLPNGLIDPKSRHGGCPVLSGVKYAANLWVWNTPRDGYPGNPRNPDFKPKKKVEPKKEEVQRQGGVEATFRNDGTDPRLANAKLYFFDGHKDTEWSTLGFGQQQNIRTYKSHVWKIKVDDNVLHTFVIESENPSFQEFIV